MSEAEQDNPVKPEAGAVSAGEGIGHTLGVALVLCAVCSLVVSLAAVGLQPLQEANRSMDRQRNILLAAGLYTPDRPVAELIEQIETSWVDLVSGSFVAEPGPEAMREQISIPAANDIASIRTRPRYLEVYLVRDGEKLRSIILPIWGLGLYSTLHGFVALAGDGTTVQGLRFYEHGETPGLGGEVDNPHWLARWPGKRIYDEGGEPSLKLVKGGADPDDDHQIDALTGATLTSRGVSQMLKYWFGQDGYGPFLARLRNQEVY